MKKTTAIISAIALIATLTACSEPEPLENTLAENSNQATTDTIESTPQHETSATTTDRTESPISTTALLEWYDLPVIFREKWTNQANSIIDIVLERVWAEEHEEKYGVTYDEVFLRFLFFCGELGTAVPDLAHLEESVRVFAELHRSHPSRQDIADIIRKLLWGDGSIPREANDMETYALLPLFELTRVYSVTQDEFVRANNRSIEKGVFLERLQCTPRTLSPS
jgi:predicted small lipoprotein YifL